MAANEPRSTAPQGAPSALPKPPTSDATPPPVDGAGQRAPGDGGDVEGGQGRDGNGGTIPTSERFDPFKWLEIEYQKATERYENIYKAYWQSFAYLFAISGAILSFGGSHLNQPLTLFLACIPLLFWYYASCVPLDRYAGQVEQRLTEIEATVRNTVAAKQGSTAGSGGPGWPRMFTEFRQSRDGTEWSWRALWSGATVGLRRPKNPRVRQTMDFAFFLIRWIALVFLVCGLSQEFSVSRPKPSPDAPTTMTIEVGKNLADVLKEVLRPQGQPPSTQAPANPQPPPTTPTRQAQP